MHGFLSQNETNYYGVTANFVLAITKFFFSRVAINRAKVPLD